MPGQLLAITTVIFYYFFFSKYEFVLTCNSFMFIEKCVKISVTAVLEL